MIATEATESGTLDDVLHSIGVDYLTATAVEPDDYQPLHSLATALFRVQAEKGNNPKAWGMAGFKGWSCGSVAIGRREKETLVRLSSDSAALSWRGVVHLATNISRIDLQATVLPHDGPSARIDRHRNQAHDNSAESGNRKVVRWVRDNRGGYTLYLGQRTSICFGRIYDKSVESKLSCYEGCIRYEVQYHNKLAKRVACALASDHQTIPRIASYCRQFFSGRGVDLELQYNDRSTYCSPRTRSDADRNLAWLSQAVRPTVLRLIACGRGAEALSALGLVQEEP